MYPFRTRPDKTELEAAVALAWAPGSQELKGYRALFTASPEVIITRAILRGNKSFPEDASSLTAPAMGSIRRWPVWQYKRAMEIRMSPLPTRLMMRYLMAAATVSPLSFAHTMAQAEMVLISMNT